MRVPDPERREEPDRRVLPDRRSGLDRRTSAPGSGNVIPIERRRGADRRKGDRRLGVERRLALQSTGEQIRAALELLTRLIDTGRLDDNARRLLDAALLRLTFALDRLGQA